jgi:GTP-binding protein HflX
LPADLLQAFSATLEELEEADLLVHVIDVSNPVFREQMLVVEDLLRKLDLSTIPCMKLFNKVDKIAGNTMLLAEVEREGVAISALDSSSLKPFLMQAQQKIGKILHHEQPPVEEYQG